MTSEASEEILAQLQQLIVICGKTEAEVKRINAKLEVVADTLATTSITSATQAAAGSAPPARYKQNLLSNVPSALLITLRPYRIVVRDGKKIRTLNGQYVYAALQHIANFESEYPGSLEAVVDMIISAFIGFENGYAPKSDEARGLTTDIIKTFNGIRSVLRTQLRMTSLPGFNLEDESNSTVVKSAKNSIDAAIKQLASVPVKPPLDMRKGLDNLASLFQVIGGSQHRYAAKTPAKGPPTKTAISGTYLGAVWSIRLPDETKSRVQMSDFGSPDVPIPLIQFEDDEAAPSQSTTPIGTPTGSSI